MIAPDYFEGHGCTFAVDRFYGDWRINNRECDIALKDVYPLLTDSRLSEVKLDDIAYKSRDFPPFIWGENCICCRGQRFRDCDYSYPGILVVGINNPYNKPYVSMDGKHRIMRMVVDGIPSANFYVLTLDDIYEHLWFFDEHHE